jgi:MFS family permease
MAQNLVYSWQTTPARLKPLPHLICGTLVEHILTLVHMNRESRFRSCAEHHGGEQEGLTPVAIGALVTVSLLGDFCGTSLIGRYADGWGRRRTLVVLALIMALTGLIFGLSSFYPLLLITAFCGTLGTTASETAPFLPLDQAMIWLCGDSFVRCHLPIRKRLPYPLGPKRARNSPVLQSSACTRTAPYDRFRTVGYRQIWRSAGWGRSCALRQLFELAIEVG